MINPNDADATDNGNVTDDGDATDDATVTKGFIKRVTSVKGETMMSDTSDNRWWHCVNYIK